MIRVTLRQVRAIEAGRATQVRVLPGERRLVKRKDAAKRGRSALRWQEPWRPRLNMEEAITGSDGRTSLTLRAVVVDRWQESLAEMTEHDARALGHGTKAGNIHAARAEWVELHDAAWVDHHKVRLAAVFGPGVVHDILCRRFEQRWAGVVVWVVEVRGFDGTRRLLADVRKGRGDYTRSPTLTIDRECEPVEGRVQRRYAIDALASQENFKAVLDEARAAKHAARGRAMREQAA